jgi:hypothetical protein
MRKTPAKYLTGEYQDLHDENPASPYFTMAGEEAGSASDLIVGDGGTAEQDIEQWLESPFHAEAILNASLGQVAFSQEGGTAGLDVTDGLNLNITPTYPVLFPGSGAVTDLAEYSGNELPSPTESCSWGTTHQYGLPPIVGLPLIANFAQAPEVGLSATLTYQSTPTAATQNEELCIVDANTYATTDTVYGAAGLETLEEDNAVFLIPKNFLASGTYTATISQPELSDVTWSFKVVPQPSISTPQLLDVRRGVALQKQLMVRNAVAPDTWVVLSGHFPSGVHMSSSGMLSGVPRWTGTSEVTVEVTDSRSFDARSEPMFVKVLPN